MGACASFPKSLKRSDREAPPPEQPKEEAAPADVVVTEKEIKVDDKANLESDTTLGALMKEGEIKETKAVVAVDEKSLEIVEPKKDSPAVIEAKEEKPLPVKDEKVEESYKAPVAPVTVDEDNKEITVIEEEKK